jgi:bifunctional non-homologous end joining protein LigD
LPTAPVPSYIDAVPASLNFIQPCSPVTAKSVPAGDDWQHEVKFDGFRVQIHKLGDEVELYSRSGSRFSRRYPLLVDMLRELPAKSAIIDGEIIASDAAGIPDFWRLFLRSEKPAELHVLAFDLIALDGKDLRKLPLERRQEAPASSCQTVRLSGAVALGSLR